MSRPTELIDALRQDLKEEPTDRCAWCRDSRAAHVVGMHAEHKFSTELILLPHNRAEALLAYVDELDGVVRSLRDEVEHYNDKGQCVWCAYEPGYDVGEALHALHDPSCLYRKATEALDAHTEAKEQENG